MTNGEKLELAELLDFVSRKMSKNAQFSRKCNKWRDMLRIEVQTEKETNND